MSSKNNAHPDWIMNGRKAAEWLEIAPSTFSERGYRPVERSGNQVLYDVRPLIQKEAVRGFHETASGEVVDYDAQRARLTKAKADLAELDVLRKQGLIIPADILSDAFQKYTGIVCQTLEGLPGDIRRTDPQVSNRSIEMMEAKVAEFRNLAADNLQELFRKMKQEAEAAA